MNIVKRNHVTLPSLMDEFFKPDWLGGVQNLRSNIPAVNIKESDLDFTIELAAPGLKKEDFHLEIDQKTLTISAELKSESEEKDVKGRYTRREFSYSSFRRAFTLPETVNEESINASYENGVLHITLPKKEEALPKPKRLIEIE